MSQPWATKSRASNANDWDVHARDFDAAGVARSDEFTVNTYTTGLQEAPTVAIANGGQLLVAWSGAGSDDQYGSFARVFEGQGVATTDEFRLHEPTPSVFEREPWVAADHDGFLVAWLEEERVAGVRLDANGTTRGGFVNAVAQPQRVAVDNLPGAEFVVVWSSSNYASDIGAGGYTGHVDGRVFNFDGTPGDGFQANGSREDPTGYGFVVDGKRKVSLSSDAAGEFAVGYDSYVPNYVYNADEQVPGYNLGAKLERVVDGVTQGSQFLANDPPTADVPDVAMTPGGNTVTVYLAAGVFALALDCHGTDISSGAVPVSATVMEGLRPSVDVNEAGEVVFAWERPNDGRSGDTIVARRFQLTGGCALCGDADENGRVTASDALSALRTSVGSSSCTLDRCDTDRSQTVTATDALLILKAAVAGGPVVLACSAAS